MASTQVRAVGKFLAAGDVRFLIKGVTYGTFAPDANGWQFPSPDRIAADFALMARYGINTVRTYTPPSLAMLDEAARHGLRVMGGLPWSQHIAFLDDATLCREIRQTITGHARELSGHPALLMLAVGNEIPPAIVRWHGRSRVERFLEDLYDDAKSAAPDTLLTYVNFPPTEYLDLPFFDVVAFNVYLHREAQLRAYITRLQLLAGNKPLLLAELGADSLRQTEEGQAELTSMQLRTAFRAGACGAIAFAWTDEWWRGGYQVEDWRFGLVDVDRRPKPSLSAVETTFHDAPFPDQERADWPKVSVVVCAYNAADTLDECLTSLEHLNYPDYEVIVVNDGSRDATGGIARRHPIAQLIDIPNGGLSAARNVGLQHATGAIVAYTDADVRVDQDWLTFLVQPFLTSDVVGSGGPNLVPPDDPWMAQCVARAPGGPTHVLLDNETAEHVPGCNMAFRREALLQISGFDPTYLRAGDDVDICWRLQAQGWKIGFAPAALVWHHHRTSVPAYWRQQVGYGEGEQWLLPHHPDKFERGQAVWRGHIYSPLPFVRALRRSQVNTGPWGTALFPSVYLRDAYPFAFMPHRIRWQAMSLTLLFVVAPLFWQSDRHEQATIAATLGALGLATTIGRCIIFAMNSDLASLPPIGRLPMFLSRGIYRASVAWLHLLQPIARAYGRVRGMLADVNLPPSQQPTGTPVLPSVSDVFRAPLMLMGIPMERRFWGERGTEAVTLLSAMHVGLRRSTALRAVRVDDGWQTTRDISVQIGWSSWLVLRVLVEDHGAGKVLARLSSRVRLAPVGVMAVAAVGVMVAIGVTASKVFGKWLAPHAALIAAGVLAAIWVVRAARVLAAVDRSIAPAAAACGMQPVASGIFSRLRDWLRAFPLR